MDRLDSSHHTQIEPLTRCNRDGAPYLRTSTVERQIEGAIALGADALVARARIADQADSQFLQEETLAYLIRRAHRAADDDVVDGLAPALVVRCKRFLTAHFRTLRPEELEELVADVMAELSEQLVETEGSDRGDFLQVRFWVVVKRLGLAAYGRAVEQSKRDSLLVALDHTGAGADDEAEQGVEVSDRLTPAPDTRVLTREALARLEPNLRQAFLLKFEGWPVEDRDATVPSISRYFRKTSRTIRNWLAQAEEQLATWRDEEAGS